MEGPHIVRNYMGRNGRNRVIDEEEAAGDPIMRLGLALALLGAMVALGVFVWRRARRSGGYEELETVELTRSEAGDTRSEPGDDTPARPSSREAPEASAAAPTAGGGSGGNVEEAPQPRAPAAAVVYGPLELRRQEGREDTSCWQALHPSTFQVRGANYMRDGKKVPSDEGSSLLAVELFEARDTVYNVAGRADAPTASLAARAPYPLRSVLVVNLVIPAAEGVYQVVFYFGVWAGDEESPNARLLERFCTHHNDAFRNARFKLLPRVAEGSWLVQRGVGSRPAILGKTLRQRFHRGPGYFEVDVDCNSSPAAGRVVSLVKSYAKSLVVDLAFVIEAQGEAELPERVIGCGRLSHIDLGEGLIPRFDAVNDV